MKRTLSVLLILVMMLGIVPVTAVSASEVHVHGEEHDVSEHVHAVTAEATSSAHLTEVPEGYIPIYDEIDLYYVRNNMTANYIMMADIDLTEALAEGGSLYNANGWIALGYSADGNNVDFSGTFDGNGYCISGLLSKGNGAGLILVNNGTIKNVTIADGEISGNECIGAITSINNGIIEQCFNNATVRGTQTVGGIVGENNGTIQKSSNFGGVWCNNSRYDPSNSYVGGITGRNNGRVHMTINHGSINLETSASRYSPNGNGYMNYYSYAGGIAGINLNQGSVQNLYNTGDVFVNFLNTRDSQLGYAGGLVGYRSSGTINCCYNVGNVTFSRAYNSSWVTLGSIAGAANGNATSITYCYYLNNMSVAIGDNTSNSCVSLSEALMKRQQSFVGFDFDATWSMGSGDYLYPVLGHIHTIAHHNAAAPTCTENGNVEYWACEKCDCYFSDEGGENEISFEDTVIAALGHDYEDVVTAPSCTEQGYTTHTCSRCGDVTVDSYVDALGHSWGGWILTTDPECEEEGVETRTCSRCGSTETRPVDPLGHDWGEWAVTTQPGCTTPGVETHTCTRCGGKETRSVAPLGHDYYDVVTEPTCTELGYTTHVCSRCGDSYVDTYVGALGHKWSQWSVTTAPGCETSGVETRTCTRCGENQTRSVEPNGHNWSGWAVTTEATCTEPGVETRTCLSCGAAENRSVEALGHDYVAVVTDPGCTAGGYTTHTCSRCGGSYVDAYTNALGHNWSDWIVTAEPTCTDAGEETMTCLRCGMAKTRPIEAKGHSWSDWTVTKAPTCTEQGEETMTCSDCHQTQTRPIDALGHSFGDWIVTTEPTCTESGVETRTCARCGEKETRQLDALGHDFSDWTVTTEPTCTEPGVETRTCSRCGEKETKPIEVLGHNWSEWTVTTPPTCTEPGEETRTCSRCGEKETKQIDALEHAWGDWTVTTEPTCTEPGEETRTCSHCGEKETKTIDALGHDWDDGVVTTPATDLADGVMTYTCARCGETREEVIPKTGKDLIDTSAIFKDVKSGSWFKKAVDFVYTYGLMNGITNDTFAPNEPMNRAMLVTVLWRAEGSPEPKSSAPFTDLKAKWYKDAVAWAYENEIVKGMSATTFAPEVALSREQIAAIMYRFTEYKGGDVSARADLSGFPDGSKTHSYAKDAMSWAVAEGLISGVKQGSVNYLDPRGNATRAQVATILMRYLEG